MALRFRWRLVPHSEGRTIERHALQDGENDAARSGSTRNCQDSTMKKPSKTAAELEASIRVEMEDICDWPTDMAISVQPDGDGWKGRRYARRIGRRRRASRNGRANRCAVQS